MDIWIPESARETPKPRFTCRICNDKFVHNAAYEQHVIKCGNVHDNELQEYAQDQKHLLMQIPDPEWEQYNEDFRRQGIDPDVQFARGRKSNIRRASES